MRQRKESWDRCSTCESPLDAMGSDTFPGPDVGGAILADKEYGDTILLVGDPAKIEPELAKHQTTGLKLEVVSRQ